MSKIAEAELMLRLIYLFVIAIVNEIVDIFFRKL